MTERWGFEEPQGQIIGGWSVKYEFWQKHSIFEWQELIAREYFEDDDEALEWLQANHPAEWGARHARPIEMRVYDQPGKKEQAAIDAANKRG